MPNIDIIIMCMILFLYFVYNTSITKEHFHSLPQIFINTLDDIDNRQRKGGEIYVKKFNENLSTRCPKACFSNIYRQD